jgi:hypothetical protein
LNRRVEQLQIIATNSRPIATIGATSDELRISFRIDAQRAGFVKLMRKQYGNYGRTTMGRRDGIETLPRQEREGKSAKKECEVKILLGHTWMRQAAAVFNRLVVPSPQNSPNRKLERSMRAWPRTVAPQCRGRPQSSPVARR